MDQDVTWCEARPQPRRLCVRWGPRSPPQKGAEPPIFSAHVYCGQTAGWMKLVLGMEVGFSPGDFVLYGDPVPFPKKGRRTPPQFSAHFYCAQTAGCIEMPLGMEVGLSPGRFVLDGDPAPSPKGGRAPFPILRVEVRISKLDRKCGALRVVANFVALEQQIILLKTRSESV